MEVHLLLHGHGAATMISEAEVGWLTAQYPNLKVNKERTEISGEITFTAAYDAGSNQFTPLTLTGQTAAGIVLTGTYNILINKGKDDKTLPRLKIVDETIPRIPDRHFYDSGHACLCGPVEESEFMRQDFSFPRYLEQLVYPFLYGQRYYDTYVKWPWKQYSHGSAGIFESYYLAGATPEHTAACLQKLKMDIHVWPRVRTILTGKERLTGSTHCFCVPRHFMKTHASVWFGIFKLQGDLRRFVITIPPHNPTV